MFERTNLTRHIAAESHVTFSALVLVVAGLCDLCVLFAVVVLVRYVCVLFVS